MIKDIYEEVLAQFDAGIISEDELNDYKKLCDEGKKESKPYFITVNIPPELLKNTDDPFYTTLALSYIVEDGFLVIMKINGEIISMKFKAFSISYKKNLLEASSENISNLKQ